MMEGRFWHNRIDNFSFLALNLFSFLVNEKESKAQLQSAREKLNEIRAARIEQETRVREASNLFLKVTVYTL